MIYILLNMLGLMRVPQLPFDIKAVEVTIQVEDAEEPEVIKFFKETTDLHIDFIGKYGPMYFSKEDFKMVFVVFGAFYGLFQFLEFIFTGYEDKSHVSKR